jgi:chromate transporter
MVFLVIYCFSNAFFHSLCWFLCSLGFFSPYFLSRTVEGAECGLLIAFLQGGLVEEYGWLTQQQLLDAIAIGQFTPGPVLSTATFIGYIIAGFPGAIVATLGIFLPSFLLVAALNPFMNPIRNSSWTRPFLDAVNVSAVALMVLTTIQLGMATLIVPKTPYVDFLGLGISIISAILAIRYRINAAYLILGGGIIGWSALMSGYLG